MINEAEISALLNSAKARYVVLVALVAGTGLRIGEALAVRTEDFDPDCQVLHVRRSVWHRCEQAPKTPNAIRLVDIPEALAQVLRRYTEGKKGFCEESEFRAIHGFLPDYLQDLALFGYCTGMRQGEVLSLKWEYLRGDVIELQAEDAKGDGDEGNARLIPMVGKDLAGILERRKIARQVKAGDTTTLAALIFHHNGKPIVDIRKAWKTACKKAGVPGRLFHDLRRSAVKNLDEAGVSRDVAMQISGHKTQAMYSHYNIADVKRVRKALERTQEFREAAAAKESKVVSMR